MIWCTSCNRAARAMRKQLCKLICWKLVCSISLLLMDLIFHIEDAYGLRFDSDQVNPSNFRTIEDTVSFVLKQKSAPQV